MVFLFVSLTWQFQTVQHNYRTSELSAWGSLAEFLIEMIELDFLWVAICSGHLEEEKPGPHQDHLISLLFFAFISNVIQW